MLAVCIHCKLCFTRCRGPSIAVEKGVMSCELLVFVWMADLMVCCAYFITFCVILYMFRDNNIMRLLYAKVHWKK
jgi:hypothetical protein